MNHCQDAVADILTRCSSDSELAAELDDFELRQLEHIVGPVVDGVDPERDRDSDVPAADLDRDRWR